MVRHLACVCLELLERRCFLSAGELDPSFGTAGVVTIPFPDGTAQIDDMEVRSDGRIVCVGRSDVAGVGSTLVMRFLVSGQLDTSFGDGTALPPGMVDTGLDGQAGKIELLPNGKILFASRDHLVRFNSDGTVDPNFVQDEPSRFKFRFITYDVDVQKDGKILLSGRYRNTPAKNGHFAVARLNANGTRDRNFGLGGVADYLQLTNSKATSIRAMPDGSIFVGGDHDLGYPNDMDEYKVQHELGMKLRPDGSLDETYGSDGVALLSGRWFAGAAMTSVVGDDGTVTVIADGERIAMARFTPEGVLDSSFSGDGLAGTDVMDTDGARATAAADGAVLLTFREYTADPVRNDVLMRFTPAGEIDTAFGNEGRSSIELNGEDVIFNVCTFANDGAILVAGQAGGQPMLARFWNDDAPAVELHAPNHKTPGTASYRFSIAVRDDVAVNRNSINSSSLQIITPVGQSLRPTFMGLDTRYGRKVCGANYKIAPPGGSWDPEDNGQYLVRLVPDHIADTAGHFSTGRIIGSFFVRMD